MPVSLASEPLHADSDDDTVAAVTYMAVSSAIGMCLFAQASAHSASRSVMRRSKAVIGVADTESGEPGPDTCASHTLGLMESELEEAINDWHVSVNAGDLGRSATAVGDPVVVLGPKGAGPISPDQFADWVERSGLHLVPRSWHPVSERLMVVEEDATWPDDEKATRVATVFRVGGTKVTAALRLPDLKSALELAYICREMAATE